MTDHLTDAELREFAAASLAPDDLLRVDDHLSDCAPCRRRAAALTYARRQSDEFRGQLSATMHLSDEQLQLYVQGGLPSDAQDEVLRHLQECPTCASQVDQLRSWALPAARVRSRWLAIAAALLLSALIPAAVWQMRSARQTTPTALAGLEALAQPEQARVRAALDAGLAPFPDFMADVNPSREVLMGSPAPRAEAFGLIAPAGTGSVTDRPEFAWQALAGADGYTVSVFDERSTLVARSPTVAQTRWIPADPLPRDRTYVWQVTAHRGSETTTVPVAPAPPVKFRVIDARSAEVLQRMEAAHPQSHLLLGILYIEAGIRDAGAEHLRQVPSTDGHADVAQRTLERLKALPR